MADVSAIPTEDIQKLEEALVSIGIPVGNVDGTPDEDLKVGILTGLTTLNRIFGDETPVTKYDAKQVAELKKSLNEFVQGNGTDPSTFTLLKALAERDFAALGLNDSSMNPLATNFDPADASSDLAARGIINSHFNNKTSAEAMPGLLRAIAEMPGYEHLAPLIEKIPPNVMADIPAALTFIENAQEYLKTTDQMNAVGFFVKPVEEGALAKADPVKQQEAVVAQVDAALGVTSGDDTSQDTSKQASRQAAIKAKIAKMQKDDPEWAGAKDGIYTAEFAERVLNNPNTSEADKAFIQNVRTLQNQGVQLVAQDDEPLKPTDITTVETMLVKLTPYVQEKYEEERARAKRLIDSIKKGRASELEIKHATKALKEAEEVLKKAEEAKQDSSIESPAKEEIAEARKKKEDAEHYLERSGLGRDIGAFIDNFIFLGETHFGRDDYGRRLVEIGEKWAIDQIQARLDNFNDLPDPSRFKLGDGRLDLVEQTALQGILVLMSEKFGVTGLDRWDYTPGLGKKIKNGILGMSLSEKEELLDTLGFKKPDGYDDLDEREKGVALDKEIGDAMDQLLEVLNRVEAANILVPQQLYYREEATIPEATIEIFRDYILGRDAFVIEHAKGTHTVPAIEAMSENQLKVLNLLTYEFTQGFDIPSLLGENVDGLSNLQPIDTSKSAAERFEAVYQQGVDLNEMFDTMETLPFGTGVRREQYQLLLKSIEMLEDSAASDDDFMRLYAELEAAKFSKELIQKIREAQEKGNVTVGILASIFGDGVAAINANPEAGSEYLFRRDRTVIIDPRLDNFTIQSQGKTITAKEIFQLHKDQVNNFRKPTRYEPLFFKDDNGTMFVGALDVESNIFQIEPVDLQKWEQIVNDTPKKPGENNRDYNIRLDKALSSVSGYDLIYQRLFEKGQATFNLGSFMKFPGGQLVNDVKSYAEMQEHVGGLVRERQDKIAEAQKEAATPTAPAYLKENFNTVTDGKFTHEPDALDTYEENPVDRPPADRYDAEVIGISAGLPKQPTPQSLMSTQ